MRASQCMPAAGRVSPAFPVLLDNSSVFWEPLSTSVLARRESDTMLFTGLTRATSEDTADNSSMFARASDDSSVFTDDASMAALASDYGENESWAAESFSLERRIVTRAAREAIVFGVGGGAGGMAAGGAFGGSLGVLVAPFTFGLSIPFGAVVGGAIGFGSGMAAGSFVGMLKGGVQGAQSAGS